MVHRKDPPQDPGRQPPPTDLRPMRPVEGGLAGDGWTYEVFWVGARALITNEPGQVTIVDARGADVSRLLPEVRRIGRALGAVECILDAVLVTMQQGQPPRPDPEEGIQRRLGATSPSRARRLAQDRPAAAMLVDLLWLEGHPTMQLPYESRRRLLEELGLVASAWQTPRHHVGDGAALLAAAHEQALPGLVAKRLDSSYQPGVASADWVTVRHS